VLLCWLAGCLALRAGPANDDWSDAIDLGDGIAVWGHGSNEGAVREAVEPQGGTGSIWWRWTARRAGNAFVKARFVDGGYLGMGIYRETEGGEPEAVSSQRIPSSPGLAAFRAEAGRSYLISAGGTWRDEGEIVIDLEWFEAPPNDDFGGRAVISGALPAEIPVPRGGIGGLWWAWTPERDQEFRVTTGRVSVVVYRGEDEDNLEKVAGGTSFFWHAKAGEHYSIALSSHWWWRRHEEYGRVIFEALGPPPNGSFASREDLGEAVELEWKTGKFLVGAGEPEHAGTQVAHSLWYSWTAPEDGSYALDATGHNPTVYRYFNAMINIYRGDSFAELETVAKSAGRVVFSAQAGERLAMRIATDGYNTVWFSFSLAPVPVPTNDDFADRLLIESPTFILEGDTGLAGVEPGEPGTENTDAPATRTLWWEWVAPDGRTVDFRRKRWRANIAFYTADVESPELEDLIMIPKGRGWLTPEPGRRYFFQVATTNRHPNGSSVLYQCDHKKGVDQYAMQAPPVNDGFADRIDLGSRLEIAVVGDVYGSTLESMNPHYPPPSGQGSIWWSWTAPYSGVFGIRRAADSPEDWVRVHREDGDRPGKVLVSGTEEILWFAAKEGEAYAIEWEAHWMNREDSAERYVGFEVVAGHAPDNDAFASARVLPAGFGHRVAACNAGATAEPGEPDHAGVPAEASVWFRWVAPADGRVAMAVDGVAIRAGVYVWEGFSELRRVATGRWWAFFDAEAGTTYWLAVDSGLPRPFEIWMEDASFATNDEFDDALVLRGSSASVNATTYGTELQDDEPGDPWQGEMVWWRWTAPESAPVKIWLAKSGWHFLAIYHGDSLSSLEPVGERRESSRFFAWAGEEYRIAVSGAVPGEFGSFELHLEQEAPGPENDAFAAARPLEGERVETTGTLEGASREGWEFTDLFSGIQSVWYRWVVPEDGAALVSVAEGQPGCIAVYRGADAKSLERIGWDASSLNLIANAGETLWIRVAAGYHGDTGPFKLRVELLGYPGNDDFSESIDMGSADSAVIESFMAGATREAGEPGHGEGSQAGSLWWRWTAPEDCGVLLDLREGKSSPRLAVYRGDSLESLVRVAPLGNRNSSHPECLWFRAEAGVEYRIVAAMRIWTAVVGDFRMELRTEPAENDDFADRIRLPAALPVVSEVPASRAGREAGEDEDVRSLWWEWTAPANEWVWVDLGGSTVRATPHVMTGEVLPRLKSVPRVWMENRVWGFQAVAGTDYRIMVDLDSFPAPGTPGRVRLELREGVLLEDLFPPNDLFADALPLSGERNEIRIPHYRTRAGHDEPEPNGWNSLWWRWTAPHTGAMNISLGKTDWAALHSGEKLETLLEVEKLGKGDGILQYRVEAGQSYWLAAGDYQGGELQIDLELGPAADFFDLAENLGNTSEVSREHSLADCSRENDEGRHAGAPPLASRWYRWTAPWDGKVDLSAVAEGENMRVAVYAGDVIGSLQDLASGDGHCSFEAGSGTEYRIVVDRDGDAWEAATDHQFDLAIEPPFRYRLWRQRHFDFRETGSAPGDDPDGDGRDNVMELTLGTDPKSFDAGAPVSFDLWNGLVRLGVRRRAGLHHCWQGFEMSEDMVHWIPAAQLEHLEEVVDHGDGTETFQVILTGFRISEHPQLYFRLVAGLGDAPPGR